MCNQQNSLLLNQHNKDDASQCSYKRIVYDRPPILHFVALYGIFILTLQRGVTSTARHSVNITCRGVTGTARHAARSHSFVYISTS